MSYPINYPTPQGANVQIFRGGDTSSSSGIFTRDWVKPQGASFVWFTLIGAGAGGGGSSQDSSTGQTAYGGGGASGNVTNFMCPAFLLPDVLQVNVGKGGLGGNSGTDTDGVVGSNGENTQVFYQQKNGTGYQLLIASGGAGGTGAVFSGFVNGSGGNGQAADAGGPMTAAGFYNATAGTNGANGGATTGYVNTTFLMGGGGYYDRSTPYTITGHYGYTATIVGGYSQLSPIPVCIAGAGNKFMNGSAGTPFGCGGTGGGDYNAGTPLQTPGYRGGDGLAIIVTW